jgi:hypothetical protein
MTNARANAVTSRPVPMRKCAVAPIIHREPPHSQFPRKSTVSGRLIRSILALCALMSLSLPASAFDVDGYRELAMVSVRQLSTGVAGDIDELMALNEQLMVLGLEGGVDYLIENPEDSAPLQLVILNAEQMKNMSLATLEDQWQKGKFLAKNGIKKSELDHFGPIMSLMDAIIQPAYAYLCLKQYKRTGDAELLSDARTKLLEISERITLFADEEMQTAQSQ